MIIITTAQQTALPEDVIAAATLVLHQEKPNRFTVIKATDLPTDAIGGHVPKRVADAYVATHLRGVQS